jgi:sec-independent protein translocase protein TatA
MPTSLGPAEILVILIVALIVLGPKRLPEAARQVGKTLAEVRKWSQGLQDEVRNVMDPDSSPPSYSYPPLPTLPAETSVPPPAAAPPPPAAVPPPEGRAPADEADPPAADTPAT